MSAIQHRVCMAATVVTAAIAAAGCGDGGEGGGVPFAQGGPPHGTPTSEEVVGCLKTAGRRTGFTLSESAADLDSVARRASDRAVAIDAGAKQAIVIFERTEREAGTVVAQYRSAPIEERGSGYGQSGTIVVVDKGYGMPAAKRKAILDCTKYGTKEQGGAGSEPAAPPPAPKPIDLDENNAKVYDRSEVADADFGTVELVQVQDPRPGKDPFQPKPGNRYIGVTFKITGKAPFGYRGLLLYGKGDKRYDEVPDPKAYSGATIDKGETKRGLLVFEVPKSVTTSALRFHVDPPVGALDTIEIRLK
jgi:hypothetical protein